MRKRRNERENLMQGDKGTVKEDEHEREREGNE